MKKLLTTALVSMAAVISLPAMATGGSYYTAYNKSTHCGGGSTEPSCPTYNLTDAGSSGNALVSLDAYYNTSGSSTLNDAYSMTYYSGSGYGVKATSTDGTSPQHAVDNSGDYEWLMLSFDQAVSLDKITLGWISGDADITVMAAGAPSNDLSGWNFIENLYYGNGGSQFSTDSYGRTVASLTNEVCASYWLIGAINPAYASSMYVGNDFFKVYSVQACTNCGQPGTGVAEPGSLALAGIGLLGVFGLRRRRS
ncbi:PEP-CTERM sorting domain-containing protein [Nitrogeniibacter mangrovi]|uniref:PEP-CTERM sorting domain-containing protein n=1 Tax=Nitrogeniibacter mangrovi TaxID=2016596 RepID=A0A6C1AZD4_9RHOO|nr:exosortase-dependent surface protein XDP1 [Nitrogeniibacter mangrovi]QID16716.1 PEP-CTERM sorting domain-containing protein [Nitrogeniibacter mangrovi]